VGFLIDLLSIKLANIIRKYRVEIGSKINKDITEEELEVLDYGLYNFFSEVIKTLLLLIIAFILGIFKYSVITLIAFGFLRKWAGGVHAKKSHVACFTSNLIINFSCIFLARKIVVLGDPLILNINFVIFCISLMAIVQYAPADVEEKPIGSIKQKRFFLIMSILTLCIYYLISIVIKDKTIGNLFIFSALGEVLTMLPITYKLTNNKRGNVKAFMEDE